MLERVAFYGGNLRIARNFLGLTLEDVGVRINVKKQYIQQLEASKRQPSLEVVAALSAALGFPAGFFSRHIANRIEAAQCHFRRLKSIYNYQLDQYSAFATLFSHLLDYLDQRLGLPTYNVPHIVARTEVEIESAAESCRSSWGIPLQAPIRSVVRVLEAAGVPLASVSGISDKLDAFSWRKGRALIVRSIDKGSGTRSRFDLAHELGHLVMHESESQESDLIEKQASRFAGAFLIPREAFKHEFPRGGFNWNQLLPMKARWGVSLQALIRRATDLAIIDEARYHWACVDLSCRGWKRAEPDELALEKGELIPRAFELLKSSHRLSPQQVALQLDLEIPVLAKLTGLNIAPITLAI